MKEYFIFATSFAAPFCSDTSHEFVTAESPQAALEQFAGSYGHPCGLYAAACYESAEAYHKGQNPLAKWVCNHELEKQRLTAGKGCYSYLGKGVGLFEIDGVLHKVENPKAGKVV